MQSILPNYFLVILLVNLIYGLFYVGALAVLPKSITNSKIFVVLVAIPVALMVGLTVLGILYVGFRYFFWLLLQVAYV